MRILFLVLIAGLLSACAMDANGGEEAGTEPSDRPVTVTDREIFELAGNNNNAAIELYRGVLKESGKNENVVLSPFSIASAMTMIYAGTDGETRAQLRQGLGFDQKDEILYSAFSALNDNLKSGDDDPVVFTIANSAWLRTNYDLLPDYTSMIGNRFGAAIEPADFGKQPDAERLRINTWVYQKTREKIPDLLPNGSILSNTVLVLVNAIYFKGMWAEEFNPDVTRELPFQTPTGSQRVPQMVKTMDLSYRETDMAQSVLVPYQGGKFAMALILPREKDGIHQLESDLGALESMLPERNEKHEVLLQLPRFKIEFGTELKKVFRTMGIEDVFTGEADFSRMSAQRDLFLSEVYHKAFIEVNEEGTEAAGATGGVVALKGGPPSHKSFIADHPFMFSIVDMKTGSILFMGRVMNPAD